MPTDGSLHPTLSTTDRLTDRLASYLREKERKKKSFLWCCGSINGSFVFVCLSSGPKYLIIVMIARPASHSSSRLGSFTLQLEMPTCHPPTTTTTKSDLIWLNLTIELDYYKTFGPPTYLCTQLKGRPWIRAGKRSETNPASSHKWHPCRKLAHPGIRRCLLVLM